MLRLFPVATASALLFLLLFAAQKPSPSPVLHSPPTSEPCTWPTQSHKFAKQITSQGMQDGLIEYIFRHIGETNRFYVEFGYDSSSRYIGSPNTRQLHERGWHGLLMDGANDNASINLHKHFLSPENILSLFAKYQVPLQTDYISIDLDSVDIWIFKTIIASSYRPRLVSVEYNCFFPLQYAVCFQPGLQWRGRRAYGSSLGAFVLAAQELGYVLVAVEPCLDAFFVRADLVQGCSLPTWLTVQKYAGISWMHGPPYANETMHLDYVEFVNTGDADRARQGFMHMTRAMKELQGLDYWNAPPTELSLPAPRVE